LHKIATVGDDRAKRGADTVDHDVEQQPGRCPRRPASDPGAAHFASRIVERDGTVASLACPPAEDLFVKLGRAPDINGWDLDVANFAVSQCWRHDRHLGLSRISKQENSSWASLPKEKAFVPTWPRSPKLKCSRPERSPPALALCLTSCIVSGLR
jgi:hypothetical protein